MKTKTRQSARLLAVCLLSAIALVVSAANEGGPYRVIFEKNSFRLQPPKTHIEVPPSLTARIVLQGVTTILGRRQVLLRITLPPHPPEPAREASVILGEGEMTDGIMVLEIDGRIGSVRVLNHGTEQTLSLRGD